MILILGNLAIELLIEKSLFWKLYYTTPFSYFSFWYRVNLPPEALPATVMEMDETEKTSNKQRKQKFDKERSEARGDAAPKTKKKSKESLSSPLAKSEDLVDEELANMDQAESLSIEVLSSNVCNVY